MSTQMSVKTFISIKTVKRFEYRRKRSISKRSLKQRLSFGVISNLINLMNQTLVFVFSLPHKCLNAIEGDYSEYGVSRAITDYLGSRARNRQNYEELRWIINVLQNDKKIDVNLSESSDPQWNDWKTSQSETALYRSHFAKRWLEIELQLQEG